MSLPTLAITCNLPTIIAAAIAKECQKGRILGLFHTTLFKIFTDLALAWFPNVILDSKQYATCLHLVTIALMTISIQAYLVLLIAV